MQVRPLVLRRRPPKDASSAEKLPPRQQNQQVDLPSIATVETNRNSSNNSGENSIWIQSHLPSPNTLRYNIAHNKQQSHQLIWQDIATQRSYFSWIATEFNIQRYCSFALT